MSGKRIPLTHHPPSDGVFGEYKIDNQKGANIK